MGMSFTIQNIRLGHATNSSSTHSIIFDPKVSAASATLAERMIYPSTAFDFGCEDFTQATPGEKLAYLAVAVQDSLAQLNFSEGMTETILGALFEGTGIERCFSKLRDGYIDHQSAFTVSGNNPRDFERNVRQCIEVFVDPRVTVYGEYDKAQRYRDPMPGEQELDFSGVRVRKDGDAIVLYNIKTGAKLRYSSSPYEKSSVPELVDVKVTNRCSYGCGFCYQDSTPDGKDGGPFSTLFDVLGKLGVFEVAIGGGEPTEMEYFPHVIRSAYDAGLTPNFTTFSTSWLLEPAKVEAAKLCGGIGVSVHTMRDLELKIEVIRRVLPNARIVAQHVFGTLDKPCTWSILARAKQLGVPVLLLGLKNTGRGVGYKNKYEGKLLSCAGDSGRLPELSVDTAFINRHPDIIKELEPHNVFLSPREGAFSMYIDSVSGKMGPSSYCAPDEMVDLPSMWREDAGDKIKEAFAKF
jgi:hypothetical protein